MRARIVSLGCLRNDADSEELAGRLAAAGIEVVPEGDRADVVLVNTCGFIDAAKKDSIDVILDCQDDAAAVVAVGCLAERFGAELASELPGVAVLGFDDYPDIAAKLGKVLAGEPIPAHRPRDRRELLPIAPAARPEADVFIPGHGQYRMRLSDARYAAVKIASGCDRHCAFCAIPAIRGLYRSRPIPEVVADARWLVEQGVKEAVLVSENSTSYGKDLGPGNGLADLLRALEGVDGLEWIRVTYLQPAELRPEVIAAIAGSDKVVSYFDVPFQHVSPAILRRMRRFGDEESFLKLLGELRAADPSAGIRSNFIVGFPGETEAELRDLAEFLQCAGLDAIGVFGYSDEEGTAAYRLGNKLPQYEIDARVEWISGLADELAVQAAEEREGQRVRVLLDDVSLPGMCCGHAAHQSPDVDGQVYFPQLRPGHREGDFVWGMVNGNDGVDLIAKEE